VTGARPRAFIAVGAICLGVVLYFVLAADDSEQGSPDGGAAAAETSSMAGAQLMVRAVDRDDPDGNGRVFIIKGGRPRQLAGQELRCERVYFAAGRGLCLTAPEGDDGGRVMIFDSSMRVLGEMPSVGLPSRARVSPDGRYGAATVFVNGHGYEAAGGFTTATTIVDMRKESVVANLESFRVNGNGRPLEASDLDYWGVTFAGDSDRFFATLRSGEHHYLVEGSVGRRAVKVLRDGVECPSLSPDGRQIAYKSRIGKRDLWHLRVLDLKSLRSHPVAERRSIDDQAEWLDGRLLVYSDGVDLFTVPADGTGAPRRVLQEASSPVALSAGRAS
jgi:hypothetical protein